MTTALTRTVLALLTGSALMLPAGPARAGSWTATKDLGPGAGIRGDIAADGGSVVAWRYYKFDKIGLRKRLMVSSGDRRGHFRRPVVVGLSHEDDWAVAARPGGRWLVTWSDGRYLRTAARTADGRIHRHRIRTGRTVGFFSLEAAADPLGGWLVAQERLHGSRPDGYNQTIEAVPLHWSGSLRGAIEHLGYGSFGRRGQSVSLAVDPAGRTLLTFKRTSPPGTPAPFESTVVAERPPGGAFTAPVAVPESLDETELAVGPGGRALVAGTDSVQCGESGCIGTPVAASLVPGALAFRAPAAFVTLPHPARSFTASAAFTRGDAGVIVHQYKTGFDAFNHTYAPIRAATFDAAGHVGRAQRLAGDRSAFPYVIHVAGGRALAVWAAGYDHRFGAAIAGADGHFTRTAAPRGSAPQDEFCCPQRSLRSAGPWVLQAWEDQSQRVRASVRRF